MIVFGINFNFFIILPNWLKNCRTNVFFSFSQGKMKNPKIPKNPKKIYAPKSTRSISAQFVKPCILKSRNKLPLSSIFTAGFELKGCEGGDNFIFFSPAILHEQKKFGLTSKSLNCVQTSNSLRLWLLLTKNFVLSFEFTTSNRLHHKLKNASFKDSFTWIRWVSRGVFRSPSITVISYCRKNTPY